MCTTLYFLFFFFYRKRFPTLMKMTSNLGCWFLKNKSYLYKSLLAESPAKTDSNHSLLAQLLLSMHTLSSPISMSGNVIPPNRYLLIGTVRSTSGGQCCSFFPLSSIILSLPPGPSQSSCSLSNPRHHHDSSLSPLRCGQIFSFLPKIFHNSQRLESSHTSSVNY